MMTYQIIEYPRNEKLLRRKARAVRDNEFDTTPLYVFEQRLAQTMRAARGAGLASTQVAETLSDDGQPWRIFVVADGSDRFLAICNPEIVHAKEETSRIEGCLSFASVGEVMRAPEDVEVRFRKADGAPFTIAATGMEARAIWHETQHLDGILIIDRMSSMKKSLFLNSVRKARGRRA